MQAFRIIPTNQQQQQKRRKPILLNLSCVVFFLFFLGGGGDSGGKFKIKTSAEVYIAFTVMLYLCINLRCTASLIYMSYSISAIIILATVHMYTCKTVIWIKVPWKLWLLAHWKSKQNKETVLRWCDYWQTQRRTKIWWEETHSSLNMYSWRATPPPPRKKEEKKKGETIVFWAACT